MPCSPATGLPTAFVLSCSLLTAHCSLLLSGERLLKLLRRILIHGQIQVNSQFPGKVNGNNYDKGCNRYRDHSGDFPDPKNEAAGEEQEFAAAFRALIIPGFRYPGEQTLTPDSLKRSHLACGTRPSGMGPGYIIFRFQYRTSLGVSVHRRAFTAEAQRTQRKQRLGPICLPKFQETARK
jgi:hypothetical protein